MFSERKHSCLKNANTLHIPSLKEKTYLKDENMLKPGNIKCENIKVDLVY